MSTVTVLSDGPARLRSTVKRGQAVSMSAKIVGRADIVGDAWSAALRGRGRTYSMGVTRSVTTVDSADDSALITLTLSADHCRLLKPGHYVFDAMDDTTGEAWVSGTLVVLRSVIVA